MIEKVRTHEHPSLPGVTIIPIGHTDLKRGHNQSVLVTMDPGAMIPLHYHSVMAIMDPTAGSAIVLSEDDDNGREVRPGHRVTFREDSLHGFIAGKEGFSFISTNGGIVDEDPTNWDISFN